MFADKPWTRHQKGLNMRGESVCLVCGIGFPYLVPVTQTICTKEDRLFLGDIAGAKDCRAL